jgi:3-deoxy-D-manno-octulosonic-acid transferase
MNPAHGWLLKGYGLAWRLAAPILGKHTRLADGFDQRLVPDGWPGADFSPAGGARFWVQAASGGEARLVHTLAPAVAAALSAASGTRAQLLLTTCTRQGLEVLEKLPSSDAYTALPRYFPLDRPDIMSRALDLAAPSVLALLETELWPGLLAAARARRIPVIVLNGRMTEKSFTAYGLARGFWKSLAPRQVLAVSSEDADRFASLFAMSEGVAVMPNIKFDGVASAMLRAGPEGSGEPAFTDPISGRRLLAAFASVRKEEESLLMPVLTVLSRQRFGPDAPVLAVAPRHMHRVRPWEEKLTAAGLPFARRSETRAAPGGGVLLWDTFGELPALYAGADAAFVGGSLAPLGGHNFLEALGQGVRPAVGPHVENFAWIGGDIFDSGLARQVPDAAALAADMAASLTTRAALAERQSGDSAAVRRSEAEATRLKFRSWLAPRLGGSAVAAEALIRPRPQQF